MEIRRHFRFPTGLAGLRFLALAVLLVSLLLGGIQLRHYAWQRTKHLRFQHDIVNGFYWGSQLLKVGRTLSPHDPPDSWRTFARGYLGLYESVRKGAYEGQYNLDYPPLRLLVMSIWTKEVKARFPGVEDGTPEYVEPLLKVNFVCEFLTALGIFLLVRLGVRRVGSRTDSGLLCRFPVAERANVCGLLAALAAWLEPSLILDAHAWPQWDVWILPFYIFAALAALKRRWFWCGALLALGAMFKGQLLFVAPFFFFWPLWQKRWVRTGHVLAGFVAAFTLVVSPWLLRTPFAWALVGLIALAVVTFFFWKKSRNTWRWTAGLTAIAAFCVGGWGSGSFAWLQVGFLYGSEHYPYLFISSCYNLPSLMAHLNWSLKVPYWTQQLGPVTLAFTWQWTLRLLYLATLVLCSLGAARHDRRRDPRLLIALATPWLLMFALLGQMHERYLLWGAVLSAVALGVSLPLSLLHFVFSAMSAAMITDVLLLDKKLSSTLRAIHLLERVRPLASWLLLVGVGIYFWEVLSRSRPRYRPRRRIEPASAEAPRALATIVEKV